MHDKQLGLIRRTWTQYNKQNGSNNIVFNAQKALGAQAIGLYNSFIRFLVRRNISKIVFPAAVSKQEETEDLNDVFETFGDFNDINKSMHSEEISIRFNRYSIKIAK